MKFIAKLVLVVTLMVTVINQGIVFASLDPGLFNIKRLPEWKMISSSQGGKLLLSDSPEMVTTHGILYQDRVQGDIRLFFYHVNAMSSPQRIAVVLENSGREVAHVNVVKYGLGGPSTAWAMVGKEAMSSYLTGNQSYQIDVPARGSVPLLADINDQVVLPDMLFNGIFDFEADRPINVKVMMLPVLEDVMEFSQRAEILPPDEHHLRGTFEGANRRLVPFHVYEPHNDGAIAVTLADNHVDRYLEGIDETTGDRVVNYGNYGVVYKIFLPSKNGKSAYYLSPVGGEYAGVLGIKYRNVEQTLIETPYGRPSFGENWLNEFAFFGIFDSNQSLWLTFSPPGASNLPVKIIIFPE